MYFKFPIFCLFQEILLSQSIYDTYFLFSSSESFQPNYWRNDDISLFFFKEANSTVFYNYSKAFYINTQPSNHTLSSFLETNISNQDSLLYLLYEENIQIFSYNVIIDSAKIQFKLNKNVMNIENKQCISLTNVTDMLLFHLTTQEIELFSNNHKVIASSYYLFFHEKRDFNETLTRIQNGSIRIYIYMPFFIENTLEEIDLNVIPLQNELHFINDEANELAKNAEMIGFSTNYSLFYFNENKTISLLDTQFTQRLNYYISYDSTQTMKILDNPVGTFIFNDGNTNSEIINLLVAMKTEIMFFQASFKNGYLNYKGKLKISDSFTINTVIDSPSFNILTVVLNNTKYLHQYFYLRIEKDKIYQRTTTFECEICSYYDIISCDQQSNDCAIILQNENKGESDSMFKIWLSVLIAVFAALVLIILCCFVVQRYCIRGKNIPKRQIQNYDEVEEKLKNLDKKKLSELMKKYSIIQEETNMEKSEKLKPYIENKCPICMDPLPSQPITYFSCKAHIVHIRCLILYEEEGKNKNNVYKCPYRCTEVKKVGNEV